MISPENHSKDSGGPPSNVKVVIALFATVGFIVFMVLGFIYLSGKYGPKPEKITVHLHPLTVEKLFHVRGASPSYATWEANITIHNNLYVDQDHEGYRLTIAFANIRSVLYFNEQPLTCSKRINETKVVESGGRMMVTLKFNNSNCGDMIRNRYNPPRIISNETEERLRAERKRGRVAKMRLKLSMHEASDFIIKSPDSTGRFWKNDVRCSNEFDVVYVPDLGKGRMTGQDFNLWNYNCKFDLTNI